MMMRHGFSFVGITAILAAPFIFQWLYEPVINYEKLKTMEKQNDTYFVDGRTVLASEVNVDDEVAIDLSIVVPAYNEEVRMPVMLDVTLNFIIDWSSKKGLKYEILVVDDGSGDDTSRVAEAYSKLHGNAIRVLKLSQNRGKGGAVKRGVQMARGKYVLMADADGATEIADLDKLYSGLKSIEVDSSNLGGLVGMSIGSRAHLEKSSIASRAWYRTILMRGFHVLVTLLCTQQIRDTQCGFKLFTRQTARILFESLHLERWAFDIELIYLAEMLGIPMIEVAVSWQEIPGSKLIETKFDVIKTSLTMARDMLCVRLSYLFGIWKPDLTLLPPMAQ